MLEVCPSILTEDSMQAQHLAATLALYNLVKGQVIFVTVSTIPIPWLSKLIVTYYN